MKHKIKKNYNNNNNKKKKKKKKKKNKNKNSKKNMKASLKTGSAQIFSCCLQKLGGSKIWGSPPFAPLARTPPLTKLKRISSSSSNYVVLTF